MGGIGVELSMVDSNSNRWVVSISIFLISVLLLLLNNLSITDPVKTGISYIYSPASFYISQMGRNLSSTSSLFFNINQFRNELNDLKIERAIHQSEVELVEKLLEQNKNLRTQLKVGVRDIEPIMAEVMYSQSTISDLMKVNVGSIDGIKSGDIVMLGNIYIGRIVEVGGLSSVVRLPSHRDSSLEVLIVKSRDLSGVSVDSITKSYISEKNVRAVMVGKDGVVMLENIPADSGVKNGDSVVIADERVGEYLYLGKIGQITVDSAAASRSAIVQIAIDYNILQTVFIKQN